MPVETSMASPASTGPRGKSCARPRTTTARSAGWFAASIPVAGCAASLSIPARGTDRAFVEFTERGQLSALRCGETPMLAPVADDARLCGFTGGPSQVQLFDARGFLRSRLSYMLGQARAVAGLLRQRQALGARRDRRQPAHRAPVFIRRGEAPRNGVAAGRPQRGAATRAGVLRKGLADPRPALEPRGRARAETTATTSMASPAARLPTAAPAMRARSRSPSSTRAASALRMGAIRVAGRGRQVPVGKHQRFSEKGTLLAESSFDARGRVTRERSWDENGELQRDEHVLEDGSRK